MSSSFVAAAVPVEQSAVEASRSLLDLAANTSSTTPSSSSSSSLSSIDSVTDVTPDTNVCAAKKDYKDNEETKRVLLSMCIGLEGYDPNGENGAASSCKLGDITLEPYASSKNKNLFKPLQKDLAAEVKRRFDLFNTLKPERFSPKNKGVAVLYMWLSENPLVNAADITFLRHEEKRFYDTLVAANEEAKLLAAASSAGAGGSFINWVGDLRLIHCILESDILDLYKQHYAALERDELDGRNSVHRPLTWEELAADRYNDENFVPNSELWPKAYSDFQISHDLSFAHCSGSLTSENVKNWFTDRKARLVKYIHRWEMSGNGDGQRHEGDANFGNATEILKYMGGDNRAAFLGPEKTSMLYKWMMYEKYELLQNTCSILPKTMGASSTKDRTVNAFVAGSAGVVTASGERSKRKSREAQQQEFELMKLQKVLDHSFDRLTKTFNYTRV